MDETNLNKMMEKVEENVLAIGTKIANEYVNKKPLTPKEILEVYCGLKLVIDGIEKSNIVDKDFHSVAIEVLKGFKIDSSTQKVRK